MEPVPSDSPVDESDVAYYYQRMCSVWGIEARDATRNPCPLAVPLRESDLAERDSSGYMVTLKTDGVRYLLLLTTNKDDKPVAIMIGRDMAMYEVQVWGMYDMFSRGTLIDGELAWCAGEPPVMKFFAFDVMAVAGQSTVSLRLEERLTVLRDCLELSPTHEDWIRRYASNGDDDLLQFIVEESKVVCTPNNMYHLKLVPKHMIAACEWGSARGKCSWGETADATTSDGLMFTPTRLPVYIGTHRTLLKWKPRSECTVDIEVREGQPYGRDDTSGASCILREIGGEAVRMAAPAGTAVDNGVYECSIKHEGDAIVLVPRKLRQDKTRGNSTETIRSVHACVVENVEEHQLHAWCTPAKRKRNR